jgi:hypothetical protein
MRLVTTLYDVYLFLFQLEGFRIHVVSSIKCCQRKYSHCLMMKPANRDSFSEKIALHTKDIHDIGTRVKFIRPVVSKAPPNIAFRSHEGTHGPQ